MADRSLSQWLSYLEALHPNSIDLGLERVTVVATALGLLPFDIPVLTVAGTNGKGSVVHVADALLRAHGMRCGRYTSPHLLSFNERICVGGLPLEDKCIAAAFVAIEEARGDVTLTYFEFATLAALWCFRECRVDVVVLEVGLGGRLDAVNMVDARVAVITSIALDHQDWLGDSLEAIGREKAGIVRRGQALVLAEASYPASVPEAGDAKGAKVLMAGRDWHWRTEGASEELLAVTLAEAPDSLSGLPIPAGLQASNVAAAVQAVALLTGERMAAGTLKKTLAKLSVPARRQHIECEGRHLILDVAHNTAAMEALAQWLSERFPRERCYAALGLMADKDLVAMAAALAPAVGGAFAVAIPGIARAEQPERVWEVLDSAAVAAAQSEFTVAAVWMQLIGGTQPDDCIVFCGSFHTIAGIMAHLDLTVPATQAVATLG